MPDPTADAPPPSYTDTYWTVDGLRLFRQGWLPDNTPRATVLLVHGYAEHSARYAHVAAHLARRGFAVHAYDQRGYGRSTGPRAYVDTFDQYLSDLGALLYEVRPSAPDQPFFLIGHSLGGTVSARYVIKHMPSLTGLVLSSPFIQPGRSTDAPFLRTMAGPISRWLPRLPTTRPRRTLISRDPDVVEKAGRDSLTYQHRLRARTGTELLEAGRRVLAEGTALTLPLYLFHGTADGIADFTGSHLLYERARSTDKTLRLYEGLYHETLNELPADRQRVLQHLTAWLEKRLDVES